MNAPLADEPNHPFVLTKHRKVTETLHPSSLCALQLYGPGPKSPMHPMLQWCRPLRSAT